MARLVFHGTTGKFTWRMLATVLVGQSVVVLFGALVARAIAASGPESNRSTAYLFVGLGLAALCVLAAGAMRRPWGVTLGWVIQGLTLLSALVVPMMFFVGLIFTALWVTSLVQGTKVDAAQARTQAEAEEQAEAKEGAAAEAGAPTQTPSRKTPKTPPDAPAGGESGTDRVTG